MSTTLDPQEIALAIADQADTILDGLQAIGLAPYAPEEDTDHTREFIEFAVALVVRRLTQPDDQDTALEMDAFIREQEAGR